MVKGLVPDAKLPLLPATFSPENEGVGMFKTPADKLAAPLVLVVVRDWTGTWVVDGVPEMSENAG